MPEHLHAPLRLGVLDFAFRAKDESSSRTLDEMMSLARLVDQLGYERYWTAEHHAPEAAHASPEIVIAAVLARTRRIRAGSAGVLLSYYSPFKVAENFRLLESLYPERVDLGIARGLADKGVAGALLDDGQPPGPATYDRKAAELMAFLRGRRPATRPVSVDAVPVDAPAPATWVLGTGAASAPLASALGTGFCLGTFLSGWRSEHAQILASYAARFKAGPELRSPRSMLAVSGVVAESEQEVARVKASHANPWIKVNVEGSGDGVFHSLQHLAEAAGVREVVFAALGESAEDRRIAYELLAKAASRAA